MSKQDRKERLAEQLRANLKKRRKQQQARKIFDRDNSAGKDKGFDRDAGNNRPVKTD